MAFSLQLDRSGDLSPLLSVRLDVVVDASGRFKCIAMVRFGSMAPLPGKSSNIPRENAA
jgi:hypothetical protein